MNLDSEIGSKIEYLGRGGSAYQIENANKDLNIGGIYTIKEICEYEGQSEVLLEESNLWYSADMFENIKLSKFELMNDNMDPKRKLNNFGPDKIEDDEGYYCPVCESECWVENGERFCLCVKKIGDDITTEELMNINDKWV